ncbi:MAG: hypothetical protein HZC17_02845 [Candidatus Omnitrophica bacterium]|nr:hypothetical protein [Candidatus Omnitrophota bacterium]
MNHNENVNDRDMEHLISRHKLKPVPDSLMKDYLAEVRTKIQMEKSSGIGAGFPVWMGAIAFTYALALAVSFGAYWLEGRPVAVSEAPVLALRESAPQVQESSQPATAVISTRPVPDEIKVESEAELAALLSLLGEEENFFDEQDLSADMERFDQLEIQGPSVTLAS